MNLLEAIVYLVFPITSMLICVAFVAIHLFIIIRRTIKAKGARVMSKDRQYFIVSEEELERLKVAAFMEAENQLVGNDLSNELAEAKAATRARPVPDWARLFVDEFPDAGQVELIINREDK